MTPNGSQPAGWYPHPTMAGTQRYWDGENWTDHVAPLTPAPTPTLSGPSVFTIAAGVALGVVALIVGIWLVVSLVTANDDLDCATKNAEHGQHYDCD
jgi:uncharacterized protein DUF2510